MFDEELERSNVNLPGEAKEVVKEEWDGSLSEACRRTGVYPAAYGEEAVEAEVRREDATEQWEQTEAGIASRLAYLENIAGDSGAVTIETLREEFEAFCDERGEAIAEEFEEPVSEAMEEYEQEQAAEVEALVETIVELLQDGQHVDPGHGKIERLAKLRGETPAETIDDLKERYPDAPDELFEEKNPYGTGSGSYR